jgi:hypothetical protein
METLEQPRRSRWRRSGSLISERISATGFPVKGDRRNSEGAPQSRRIFPAAETAHYASLLLTFLLLLRLGRQNWFFGDDWDFLVRRGLRGAEHGLFQPHNEHWSTIPILIYRSLFFLFGLRTYLPYFAVVLVLHLAVGHVVWRLLRQTGVAPWLSTALVATFLVSGAGAENFMWSFQIGFVGALLLGLIALLLLNHSDPAPWRDRLAVGTAVVSLLWAGVAVPLVAAGGILAAMRHGWRAGLRFVGPPAVVYLVWLKLVGYQGLHTHEVTKQGLLLVPSYTWQGLVTTVHGYTFFQGGGPVILLALGYALLRRPGWTRTPAAAALAAALGAICLFLTVAPGRVAYGVDQANAGRYHYLAWALLLPSIGVCLADLAGRDRGREFALIVLVSACVVHGFDTLDSAAGMLRERDETGRRQVMAAAEFVATGAPVFPVAPSLFSSPDLRPPSRLVALLRSGKLPQPRSVTPAERLSAIAALQVRFPPFAELPVDGSPGLTVRGAQHGALLPGPPGCVTLRPQGGRPEVTLGVSRASGLSVTSNAGGELRLLLREFKTGSTSDIGLTLDLKAGAPSSIDVGLTAAVPVFLLPEAGETTLCGVLLAG